MNTLKNLLSITVLILFAGCATVTDANIDAELPSEPTVETTSIDGEDWFSGAGNTMDPILGDRPKTDER